MPHSTSDTKAFELFFKENYSLFYFTAYHLLDDEELSRDMVSECMEAVWRNCQNGDVAEWKAYFYRTVRNRCIDHLRHEAVKQRYLRFYEAVTSESPFDNEEEESRVAAVYQGLEQLPELPRKVLDMCYFQRMSYREVAEQLDISLSYVKKLIMTALRLLRESVST